MQVMENILLNIVINENGATFLISANVGHTQFLWQCLEMWLMLPVTSNASTPVLGYVQNEEIVLRTGNLNLVKGGYYIVL